MLLIFSLIGFCAVALAHIAPAPFLLEALRPRDSIWHMPRDRANPAVYLTFDDGPNAAWTPALLDVLAREDARATFFVIDKHITDETTPILTRIAADGHAIGLHSDRLRPVIILDTNVLSALMRTKPEVVVVGSSTDCRHRPGEARDYRDTQHQTFSRG